LVSIGNKGNEENFWGRIQLAGDLTLVAVDVRRLRLQNPKSEIRNPKLE